MFSFINDDELRNILERDKAELDECIHNHLCKSSLLLSGSITEAVLVDYFLEFPPRNISEDKILLAPLHQLINWADETELISEDTKNLTTVIRDYRNIIHPGKEIRVKFNIDVAHANAAANLVEIIVAIISKKRSEKIAYTAEKTINKIMTDPSSKVIINQIIKKMSGRERIKLIKLIPVHCAKFNISDDILNTIYYTFGELSKIVPENIKKDIIYTDYNRFHNEELEKIIKHFKFSIDFVEFLSSDQIKDIIEYIFELLREGSSIELDLLKEIGINKLSKYIILYSSELQELIIERSYNWPANIMDADTTFIHLVKDSLIKADTDFMLNLIKEIESCIDDNYKQEWKKILWENKSPYYC